MRSILEKLQARNELPSAHGIRQPRLAQGLVAKKTGYVERAGFRMSEGDRQRAKHAREWRAILVKLALFVLAVVVLIVVKRTML